MPVFTYSAKDLKGEYHKGEIEAVDTYQVALILRRKKLIVLSIKAVSDTQRKLWDKIFSRISFNEIVIMTRQLATMIQSGLVLSESLDILEEQQENKQLKKILKNISSDIKGGLDFASALEKYPEAFPSLYAKLIRAGQASGKLDTILLELATNLEKEREFKSKVRSAMIYPAVIAMMMVAVMLIMVFFVMPKLLGLYKESGIDLPLPTKIMMFGASILINFWWAIALALIILVLVGKRYFSTPQGRLAADSFLLKFPVVGRIIQLVILTDFTRTFGLLLSSGLPILEAIKIVADIAGNKVYKNGLEGAYQGVERGLSFSSQLLATKTFPRIVGQMAKIGEETGKLDEIMQRLSSYFEMEADRSLKNVTTLIEPIVLVILGIGVGFLVISIILPIYQLTTSIK